ncbi:hypothetical protein BHM03_00052604 [Ensete ventricosum]|nr:hypothetical protein BHM03_00052604 [Ensete ventricosum]
MPSSYIASVVLIRSILCLGRCAAVSSSASFFLDGEIKAGKSIQPRGAGKTKNTSKDQMTGLLSSWKKKKKKKKKKERKIAKKSRLRFLTALQMEEEEDSSSRRMIDDCFCQIRGMAALCARSGGLRLGQVNNVHSSRTTHGPLKSTGRTSKFDS